MGGTGPPATFQMQCAFKSRVETCCGDKAHRHMGRKFGVHCFVILWSSAVESGEGCFRLCFFWVIDSGHTRALIAAHLQIFPFT